MSRVILGIVFALCATLSQAQDSTLRQAVQAAVTQQSGAINLPAAIEVLGAPSPTAQVESLRVYRARFDSKIGWLLEMRCVPNLSCLPFLVRVRSEDPTLFRVRQTVQEKRIRAGQKVVLVSRVGAVECRQQVQALASAATGEKLRVRLANGRILQAAAGENGIVYPGEPR